MNGAPLATTSSCPRRPQWRPQNSPPQRNPVGTLALTTKSRTGILALISTLSERASGRTCVAGRSASTLTNRTSKQSVAGEPAARDHAGAVPGREALTLQTDDGPRSESKESPGRAGASSNPRRRKPRGELSLSLDAPILSQRTNQARRGSPKRPGPPLSTSARILTDRRNGVGSTRWDFHKRQMPPGDAPSSPQGMRPAPQPHSPGRPRSRAARRKPKNWLWHCPR
jgi:hypothetical protein